MAISGTGTGPFVITGTETTLNLYNYVVAQNAANATKNAANTQFTFSFTLTVGDGTTTTLWNPTEQEIEINATSFTITTNATVQCGTPNGARAGCYFKVICPEFGWVINGNFNAYASRLYSQTTVRANTSAVIYIEDCNNAFLNSISNGEGTQTPTISYIRGTHAGATAVAIKLGGNMVLDSPRIYNATYAFQPFQIASGAPTYTVKNYISVSNTNDVIPNIGTSTLNIIGAFDSTGTPRSSLIVSNPTATSIVRLQWTYDLYATSNGVALVGATVRIQRTYGTPTTVFSGTTDSTGKIAQQTLTRWEYQGVYGGIQQYPYLTSVRKYDKASQELVYNADNHAAQVTANPSVTTPSLSQAAAAALTGITLTAKPSTSSFTDTITNGSFNSDTAWTKGSGVTISGGAANCVGAGYILGQVNSLVVGTIYTFSMTYVKTAGIKLRVSSGTVDGTNIVYTSGTLANGSGTLTFTFTAARSGIVIGASDAVFSGSIDNVSCGINTITTYPNDGALAISSSKSVGDTWSYWRNFISTIANFESADTWGYNGAVLDMGAWTSSITGGTVSGGTLVSPTISVVSPAIVSANLTGAVTNSGTVSGVIIGNVTNTGTINGATVTGNVTQATPTNLTGVTINGNLTYNTNTPITITLTNTTITGTVSNSGTGLVTISLGNSTLGTVGSNITTRPVTALTLNGLTAGSQIYISNNLGAQVAYVASSGTSYTLDTTGYTGAWVCKVARYGYSSQGGTFFPAIASLTATITLVPDIFVTEADFAVVAAYTTLETLDKLYDYAAYYETTNGGIVYSRVITKAGTAASAGSYPVTLNSTGDVWAFSGSALEINSTTTLAAGTTITGSLFTSSTVTLTDAQTDTSITANVLQTTPTDFSGMVITGNLTYNIDTDTTVTFTDCVVTGAISNSGAGVVKVLKAGTSGWFTAGANVLVRANVTITTASGLALTTSVLANGYEDLGWIPQDTARVLEVAQTDTFSIYAIAYGYQAALFSAVATDPTTFILALNPEVYVDTTLDPTIRDTIVASFYTYRDDNFRLPLTINTDLRDYSTAQVMNALQYYVVTQGYWFGTAVVFGAPVNGFTFIQGGVYIADSNYYFKVDDSVTTPTNLGYLLPVVIGVDPAVYAAYPTYSPVEMNTSDIVMQYAPWTHLTAELSTSDKTDIAVASAGTVWSSLQSSYTTTGTMGAALGSALKLPEFLALQNP